MSAKTGTIFVCDLCKATDTSMVEDAYEVPMEWLTVRIAVTRSASTAADIHLCPTCKWEPVTDLWEKI